MQKKWLFKWLIKKEILTTLQINERLSQVIQEIKVFESKKLPTTELNEERAELVTLFSSQVICEYGSIEFFHALEENRDNSNCIHIHLKNNKIENTESAVKAANKRINEIALESLIKINHNRPIDTLEYYNKLINSLRMDKYKLNKAVTENILGVEEKVFASKDKIKVTDKIQLSLLKKLDFTLFSGILEKICLYGQNYSVNELLKEISEITKKFSNGVHLQKKHIRFLRGLTFVHSRSKNSVTVRSQYELNYEVLHLLNTIKSREDLKVSNFTIEDTEKVKNIRYDSKKINLIEIYLCLGTVSCFNKQHKIESVVANILCEKTNDYVRINVGYCYSCNKYFINEESLDRYREKYGIIFIKINAMQNKHGDLQHFNFLDFRQMSELAVYGYSVKENGLSKVDRQKLLVFIIEFKLMKKQQVIKHIEYLVRFMGRRHKNANAKWKSDLSFLNNYNINAQREVFGNIIQKSKQY